MKYLLIIIYMQNDENGLDLSRKFGLWVRTRDPDVVQFRGLLCDFGAEGTQSQLELLPVQRIFNSQLLHVKKKKKIRNQDGCNSILVLW